MNWFLIGDTVSVLQHCTPPTPIRIRLYSHGFELVWNQLFFFFFPEFRIYTKCCRGLEVFTALHRVYWLSQSRSRAAKEAAVVLAIITAGLGLNHSLSSAEEVLGTSCRIGAHNVDSSGAELGAQDKKFLCGCPCHWISKQALFSPVSD